MAWKMAVKFTLLALMAMTVGCASITEEDWQRSNVDPSTVSKINIERKDFLDTRSASRTVVRHGINKKTRTLTPVIHEYLTSDLMFSIEYWLIREAKAIVERDYIRGKTKKHTFKPHLYGGVYGIGGIFKIKDNDDDSYAALRMYLKHKTQLEQKIQTIILNTCFPQYTYYKVKTSTFGTRANSDNYDCVDVMKTHNVPYYGIKNAYLEPFKIMNKESVSSYDLSDEFWAYFNSGQVKVKATNEDRFVMGISMDNDYILDQEIAFSKNIISGQVREDMFATRATQVLLNDNRVAALYADYDMNHALLNGFLVNPRLRRHRLFEFCDRKFDVLPVAYRRITKISYGCYNGGYGKHENSWVRKNFRRKPVWLTADVTFTSFSEEDALQYSLGQVSKAHMAFVEIDNIKSKTDVYEELTKKQLPSAFLAWTENKDGKLTGYVQYYGILFEFDLTKLSNQQNGQVTAMQ